MGTGINQFGRWMMLEGLSRQITLYGISKPREVRFRSYLENGIQIPGMMFAVNYEEIKIADKVGWETIRIRGPRHKVMYWCCLKKV